MLVSGLVYPLYWYFLLQIKLRLNLLPFEDRVFFSTFTVNQFSLRKLFPGGNSYIVVRVYSLYLTWGKKVAFGQSVLSLDRFSARASTGTLQEMELKNVIVRLYAFLELVLYLMGVKNKDTPTKQDLIISRGFCFLKISGEHPVILWFTLEKVIWNETEVQGSSFFHFAVSFWTLGILIYTGSSFEVILRVKNITVTRNLLLWGLLSASDLSVFTSGRRQHFGADPAGTPEFPETRTCHIRDIHSQTMAYCREWPARWSDHYGENKGKYASRSHITVW